MSQLSFRTRRRVALVVTGAALLCVAAGAGIDEAWRGKMSSGWTLLTTVSLLMLIGLRRRLPILSWGSMSGWTQCHLYLGLFSIGVYLWHVPSIFGSGGWLSGLSLLFLLVAGSGLYGIYASRTVPKQLTELETLHPVDGVLSDRSQIARQALQFRLRVWLVVHAVLSVTLLVAGIAHAWTVW